MSALVSDPPSKPVRWRASHIEQKKGARARILVRIVKSQFWYEARTQALRYFASRGCYLGFDEPNVVPMGRT